MIVTGVTMEGFANFKSLAEIPSHPVAFLEPSLSICLPITWACFRNPYSKFILAIKTLSKDRFSIFLQVLLRQIEI